MPVCANARTALPSSYVGFVSVVQLSAGLEDLINIIRAAAPLKTLHAVHRLDVVCLSACSAPLAAFAGHVEDRLRVHTVDLGGLVGRLVDADLAAGLCNSAGLDVLQ